MGGGGSKRKPISVVLAEEDRHELERVLSFWDLMAVGVGGTVGSGVFVLAGLIAHDMAGPASALSWVLAGVGCILSGMAYAELSWRVPSSGGAYAYAFVALGELPAVMVAWALTLEYGVSAAAVARSWGDKMELFLTEEGILGAGWVDVSAGPDDGPDGGGWAACMFAAVLQAACAAVVAAGVKTSALTINAFCLLKTALVAFMIVTAFTLHDQDNLRPFAPHGAGGVMRGAGAAFFGYLGFDEVCLLSQEAKDPHHAVPRALLYSLVAVMLTCTVAALALVGTLPYDDISPDSGFGEAFKDRGLVWAYKITAVGEVVTLPLVVLVSFMAQPRLLYCMAKDGLISPFFAQVDRHGTLLWGTLASGLVCMVVAAAAPFAALDGVISAGILLSFNATNSCLLVLRWGGGDGGGSVSSTGEPGSPSHTPNGHGHRHHVSAKWPGGGSPPVDGIRGFLSWLRLCLARAAAAASNAVSVGCGSGRGVGREGVRRHVCLINALMLGSALALVRGGTSALAIVVAAVLVGTGVVLVAGTQAEFPEVHGGGGGGLEVGGGGHFRVPLGPWIPVAGMWLNNALLTQLAPSGLLALAAYAAVALAHYWAYGARHSIGNRDGWACMLQGVDEGGGRQDVGQESFSESSREALLQDGWESGDDDGHGDGLDDGRNEEGNCSPTSSTAIN